MAFHYGNTLSSKQANFDGNYPCGGAETGPLLRRPTTVGSYQPNGFGLYDMHGNVWQWCEDVYVDDYRAESPKQDPKGPPRSRDPKGPPQSRVLRGGGWYDRGTSCRSSFRNANGPGYRSDTLGFRVAAVTAGGPPAKTEAPKPLPENIVTAWKEAGAVVGWLRPMLSGFHSFVGEKEGKPGDLPAFLFRRTNRLEVRDLNHLLVKLPIPATAFGLDLSETEVTDAGLKELAGLKSLQTLNLSYTLVTDAGLKELAGLKSLQALNLGNTQVTDAGLKELAGLKLKTLVVPFTITDLDLKHYLAAIEPPTAINLSFTPVTDAGLKELAELKSLQALNLGGTKVTDAGLKELAGLKSLQSLDLGGTPVTDAGLKELAGLKSLQTLNLGGTKVTDAGLKELAGLKSLQSLDLGGTKVTDAGLKELAGLKSLQTLNLYGTKVTDAGLKELAGLKSLQTLDLLGTKVTNAGLKELREALPGCIIIH